MHYYRVALLGKRLSPLTYAFPGVLEPGTIVGVALKSSLAEGVVLEEVAPPAFATVPIDAVDPALRFLPFQIDTARFLSSYYRCEISEALALMVPFAQQEADGGAKSVPVASEELVLTSRQLEALKKLQELPAALLFGPTGSGKTEIYIELFKEALEEDKSGIFLMPEISLTPQMERRLRKHFGSRVAVWHSKLTKKRRQQTLERIRSGEVRIVAGPRSALFLPLKNLGCIVVDEEHDDSYKAHNRPRYHARDVALYLGKRLGAKVVLGSATPAVTSYARQPIVKIEKPFVETKKRFVFEGGGCELTPRMIEAIGRHTRDKGQVLVFLPTRANFKYLYCESCGYHVECPFCSVGMSLHRHRRVVQCHYCGYAEKIPEKCPRCGDVIRSDRMGTAEMVERLRERFPSLTIQQFDKDTITTAGKLQKALDRFSAKETDILVGTQMLAKGHDYPDITLAIVLGLDYILALPDYRARERAMSLFFQITGRAGRAREAEVIVQTNQPEFFTEYVGDYERFLKEEIAMREGLYPPHMHLCRFLFAARNEAKGQAEVARVRAALEPFADRVEIVGAGKAPIEKIAGKFRFQILLRSAKRTDLMRVVKVVDDGSFEIDMDPVDFA